MHKAIRIWSIFSRLKHPAFFLLLLSGISLLLGTILAASAGTATVSWMRQALNSRLSIVCHLALQLLPFLFSAYAVNISGLWLLYLVCSLRMFSFAYIGSLIWLAFGAAAWLVRLLVLFSDVFLIPVLLWYGFRRTTGYRSTQSRDFWICIGTAVVTALINWLFISPFLVRIIDI